MTEASNRPRRRSVRLRDYDYSTPGAYFVTICTIKRRCVLGTVADGDFLASRFGRVVDQCWRALVDHYPTIELDSFVIMPNHVHGIVLLTDGQGRAGLKPASTKRPSFTEVVRGFKTFSSRRINEMRDRPGTPVWQRGFYEHVVRNERELDGIRRYIEGNPAKWAEDEDNPANR